MPLFYPKELLLVQVPFPKHIYPTLKNPDVNLCCLLKPVRLTKGARFSLTFDSEAKQTSPRALCTPSHVKCQSSKCRRATGAQEKCKAKTWDYDTKTFWKMKLISTDTGWKGGVLWGLTLVPSCTRVLWGGRGWPQLGSIVRTGLHQMPRWQTARATVAEG